MGSDIHSILRARFDAAFVFPIAAHPWKTKRGRSFWIELEWWQDALAGPLSSIVERGECAYVYKRDDEFFAGVDDPTTLRARLRQWHENLIAGLDRFDPGLSAEMIDLESMRQFASTMWDVAEQAIDIERVRWEAAGGKSF